MVGWKGWPAEASQSSVRDAADMDMQTGLTGGGLIRKTQVDMDDMGSSQWLNACIPYHQLHRMEDSWSSTRLGASGH